MIPALCYALILLAWIIDLFTPQLFVASILSNGPIALSSLALRPSLTVRLIVIAEVANVIAAYVNGVQAGRHWDSIAIGDRTIAAATFILVGVLTIRSQESARRAGQIEARERQAERERSLRVAMEHVRASLNIELVMRSAVREARRLTGAPRVDLILRPSTLDLPVTYELREGDADVTVTRTPLTPELSSLAERSRADGRPVRVDADDLFGKLIGENALVASFDVDTLQATLYIGWGDKRPAAQERDTVQAFVDNVAVALQQARLFIRLAEQNTEIEAQKDALQARSDVIRDIVYALAHDLRTPLAAADVTMKQALEGAYGDLPARYREILRTTVASNLDLRRLVETLLLVARYEAGEDSQMRVHQEVAPLVERVELELRPLAQAKSVDLHSVLRDRDAAINVDPDEIRRAITNLVANALDATPAGGHVTVATARVDGRMRIEVQDDGYGVPPERRSSLFHRFGGVRAGGGTGLGLYIVQRIAEKYGGHAGYEPREPRGSRFYIDVPLTSEN